MKINVKLYDAVAASTRPQSFPWIGLSKPNWNAVYPQVILFLDSKNCIVLQGTDGNRYFLYQTYAPELLNACKPYFGQIMLQLEDNE